MNATIPKQFSKVNYKINKKTHNELLLKEADKYTLYYDKLVINEKQS